jgi:LPXTG-site transpeptidase (sortase) family protein
MSRAFSRRALLAAGPVALLAAGCAGRSGGSGGRTAGAAAPTGTRRGPGRPTPSSGTPSARPLARSVPVRLRVPAIGVDTALLRLGLDADGSVAVPPIEKDAPAGWYDGSPTPGQTGPAVILGHVTVGAYGDGVFRHLDRLRAGDRIAVRRADGTTAEFAVTRTRTVDKAHFPTSAVYGNVGRPELRLITCGGPRTGTGYRDNVIVFAALTSSSGER